MPSYELQVDMERGGIRILRPGIFVQKLAFNWLVLRKKQRNKHSPCGKSEKNLQNGWVLKLVWVFAVQQLERYSFGDGCLKPQENMPSPVPERHNGGVSSSWGAGQRGCGCRCRKEAPVVFGGPPMKVARAIILKLVLAVGNPFLQFPSGRDRPHSQEAPYFQHI